MKKKMLMFSLLIIGLNTSLSALAAKPANLKAGVYQSKDKTKDWSNETITPEVSNGVLKSIDFQAEGTHKHTTLPCYENICSDTELIDGYIPNLIVIIIKAPDTFQMITTIYPKPNTFKKSL